MRLEGVWTAGREVYGYFLTDEEFELIKVQVVQSGYLGGLGWETPYAFLADCGPRERSAPPAEFVHRLEQGGFIVGSTIHLEELLDKYGLNKRKISSKNPVRPAKD